MNKARLFALISGGLILGWSAVTDTGISVSAQDKATEVKPAKVEYKAITREQIEKLAPQESKERTDKLTLGLNVLATDGWRLVAIEPYHARPFGSGGMIHHPVR